MIDVYYWTTPNGHKITIFLEETGLPYSIKPVNIGTGEQFKPEFLAISPNNRIPAIVDNNPAGGGKPISVFESGAILQYLAEKTGKFLPADLRGRTEVMQWLFWQMGGLGPMLGQNHHFQKLLRREAYLCDQSLCQRNRTSLRSARRTARRSRVRGRRVFDCGYGVLSLDRAARSTGPKSR
jgi:GST-like protein